jgi:biotin transporter BioY
MSGIVSLLTQKYPSQGSIVRLGFTLIGGLFLFVPGLLHLANLFGWEVALKTGLLPFVFSEPTKYALAAYLSVFIRDKLSI